MKKRKKSDSLNSSVESEDSGLGLKGQIKIVGSYGESQGKFNQTRQIYDKKGISPTLVEGMRTGGGLIPTIDVSGQMKLTSMPVKSIDPDSEIKNSTKEILGIFDQSKFLSLIFLQQDFPVKVFPLLENVKVFRIEQGELFSLTSAGSLEIKDQATYSLRMLRDYFHMTEGELSRLYSFHWMNLGMMSNGKCSTLSIGCPKIGKGSLSSVLEETVNEKYYISNEQLSKIQNRERYGDVYAFKDKNSPTVVTEEHNIPMLTEDKVRRLTPIECERLQGFSDNWTKECSDTQRYKQMGNAVSVPVITAIGKKILEVI